MAEDQMTIRSDPYHQKIEYFRWSREKDVWCDLTKEKNSKFADKHYQENSVSHIAYDILQEIKSSIYNSNKGLRIDFCGTEEDYRDLSDVREFYFDKDKINIIHKAKIPGAKAVMAGIDSAYAGLNRYFEEYPDKEMQNMINRYQDAVGREINLVVMGLYSSGKSAFINSLIGQEILPSDADPTTAKIYKISESKERAVSFTFDGAEYKLEYGDSKDGKRWKCAAGDPASEIMKCIGEQLEEEDGRSTLNRAIYRTLCALNAYAKKEENEAKEENVDRRLGNLIEIHAAFGKSYLPKDEYRFVIYDTPGSDAAAYHGHIEVLKETLKAQTNGLPIFVTAPDKMDQDANKGIMGQIDQLGTALDLSNMLLVVNRSDESCDEELKKKKENKRNLVVAQWHATRIYFVSSILGLGGKMEEPDKRENWIDGKYYNVYSKNKDIFGDPNHEQYMQLYEYNILPENVRNRDKANISEEGSQELLLWNSGLPSVEKEIGDFARKYAPYNKCRQAIGYLQEAAKLAEEKIDAANERAEEKAEAIQSRLDGEIQELMQEMEKIIKEEGDRFSQDFSAKITDADIKKYRDPKRINRIVKGVKVDVEKEKKKNRQEMFDRRLNECVAKDTAGYCESVNPKLKTYCENRMKDLCDALKKCVAGTDALTEEQKKMIEEKVFAGEKFEDFYRHIDFAKSVTSKKILFITRVAIDVDKASEEYEKRLTDGITESNQKFRNNNEELFTERGAQIKNDLIGVAASYNSTLKKDKEELEEQQKIMQIKGEEKRQIAEKIEEINELIEQKEA